MSNTEQKGLAMVNEVQAERGKVRYFKINRRILAIDEALCRAIEQREAIEQKLRDFKQKVSDVVVDTEEKYNAAIIRDNFGQFIIPKPKPDPLVEVVKRLGWHDVETDAPDLRATLADFGYEIREKNDE